MAAKESPDQRAEEVAHEQVVTGVVARRVRSVGRQHDPTGAALITTRRRTPAPSMACAMAAVAGATIPAWAARLGPTAEITASTSRSAAARTSLFRIGQVLLYDADVCGQLCRVPHHGRNQVTGSNGLAEDLAADATGGAEQGELTRPSGGTTRRGQRPR